MKRLLNSLPQPLVVAHRGGSGEAPENTLEAFERCKKAGIRCIETDVWLGEDGELYVLHGKPWHVFIKNGPLHITPELRRDLPRLRDVLKRYPDIFFSVDPKHMPAFVPLANIISTYQATDRVCISSSFYWRSLRIAKQFQAEKGINILIALPALGIVTHLLPKIIFQSLKSITETTVIAYPPKWMATKRLVELAHANGLKVIVQKVNNSKSITRATKVGADGFMTDHPLFCLRYSENE